MVLGAWLRDVLVGRFQTPQQVPHACAGVRGRDGPGWAGPPILFLWLPSSRENPTIGHESARHPEGSRAAASKGGRRHDHRRPCRHRDHQRRNYGLKLRYAAAAVESRRCTVQPRPVRFADMSFHDNPSTATHVSRAISPGRVFCRDAARASWGAVACRRPSFRRIALPQRAPAGRMSRPLRPAGEAAC